jgi:flagellar protein FliL
MFRKLLPLLLALAGLGIGSGAGLYLRPAPDPAATHEAPETPAPEAHAGADTNPETAPEYVKLSNQFVIPVLEGGRVASMVILAISLEVTHGSTDAVYAREPKLRDALLQVLFDHANSGGFKGDFTDGSNLVLLRKALLESAQSSLGEIVTNVLINDIARQDS